ncbi:hypothetical protein [Agrobacterium tumefaciens]|uniref:hypothetical protein n=1 Tax=Agrobacterium tumefaciens TaxID=358 RepID=UPI0004727845
MSEPSERQEVDEAVLAAARWIAGQEPRQDIIPQIKTRFGLTAVQASQACALAVRYRTGGALNG